ncbi:MAG: MopE-related protein, partial [Flavobacteriales bacterium]
TIDVVIDNVAGANNLANIDFNAAFAYLYDNEASCRNLTISAKQVRLTGSVQDILNINGNLTIGAAGLLNMDDGTAAADGVVTITGNWNNSANAQFAEGNGTVEFNGNTLQTIATTGGEQFYNLAHNNSAAVSISNNTIVTNTLTMNAGNINTASNILTLGTYSSNAGTLSCVSGIINGNFRRWTINSGVAYRFPIGTSTSLQEVTITHQTAPTAGTITTAFIASDPGNIGLPLYEPNASVQQQFSQGYWNISGENGLVANDYNLTLLGNGFSGPTFDENARIIFRENNEPWELAGTHLDATAPLARRASLNVFGEFGIASARECVTSFSAPNIVNQETCENGTLIPFTITPTDGSGTLNYQWYQTPVNSNAGGESLGTFGGAQTTTFSPPSDAPGTIYYYLEVTQPGTICPAAVSSVVSVTISEINTPTVTIVSSALGLNACSNESITFTATAMFAGTTPNYQWFVSSTPVGSNQNTYTFTPTAGPQEVYVSITSSDVCNNGQTAQSNLIAFNTVNPSNFYQDLDGDGFGNQLVFINACEAPIGYVALSLGDLNGDGQPDFDCNDNDEDINPAAEEYCSIVDDDCDNIINEDLPAITYYADNDGDGFGNPSVFVSSCTPVLGYVNNNGDCDDNNFQANPLMNELCNGFDDDCDLTIDEFCGPVNDEYLTGFILNFTNIGSCSNAQGTLLGANPSPEANSTAITGQDVWYYFVAPAPGLSVQCASAVNDILLELQDDAGNTLDIENLVSGVGAERLNYVGLIPGNTYFIAVRNYNSAIGVGGVFTICAQLLQASSCDAPGPIMNINRCAGIKADFTYANQYIFHLDASTTLTGSYNSNVGGLGLTTVVLLNEFEVTYGDFYPAVLVDALYLIPNGAGTVESLIVPGTTPMAVSLSSQPDLYVRASDACPNNKSLASLIRAEPFICGPVIDYQWEFTQVLPMPGLPVTAFRGLNDRLFRINLIPGVQPGATYSVRVRPIFAGNIPGNWSATPSCIKVLGAATFTESSDIMIDQPNERSFGTETNSLNATVFPNPNAGDAVFVSLTGIQDKAISIRILDALGKSVFENTFPVEETEHTLEIALDRTVPAGLYFLEVVSSNERKSVSKLLIQR